MLRDGMALHYFCMLQQQAMGFCLTDYVDVCDYSTRLTFLFINHSLVDIKEAFFTTGSVLFYLELSTAFLHCADLWFLSLMRNSWGCRNACAHLCRYVGDQRLGQVGRQSLKQTRQGKALTCNKYTQMYLTALYAPM